MATTWVFEHEGEEYFVQRQDRIDRITVLTWGTRDQDVTTVRTALEAAQLVAALEADLVSRHWTLVACYQERRQGGDRRGVSRPNPDRRRRGIGPHDCDF